MVVEDTLDVLAGRARGGNPRQRINVVPGFFVVRGQGQLRSTLNNLLAGLLTSLAAMVRCAFSQPYETLR